MFDELPETIPQKNKKRPRAIALAAVIHVVLVSAVILVQMVMPEKLGEFQLLTTLYMAPPPAPPPPPLGEAPEPRHHAVQNAAVTQAPAVVEEQPPPSEKPEMTAPTTIPRDIARIVETGPPSGIPRGAPGGVAGGVSSGVSGGLLGGVLGGVGNAPSLPPPPEPVRVGGNVKQPRIIHIEQPRYPPEAKKAHIEGVVIVEATVTAEGNIEKVKVISGPPMLVGATVEAVSRWKYEPTYLNGQPTPVILTARINFSLTNASQ